MQVTLEDTDVATLIDQGTVVVITGTGEDGQRVTFGADARAIEPALRALVMDEEFSVDVEVDEWQILRVTPVEAP